MPIMLNKLFLCKEYYPRCDTVARPPRVASEPDQGWKAYNAEVRRRLIEVAAKETAATSKGYAISRQAPKNCDEIDFIPGLPTFVINKDRRTGAIRHFRFTFQWKLVEVEAVDIGLREAGSPCRQPL
jgi:hypothetical protein